MMAGLFVKVVAATVYVVSTAEVVVVVMVVVAVAPPFPIGSPKKVAERPPRSPSSGFLDELHSKGTMGKPSPLFQLPSCRGIWLDQPPRGRIFWVPRSEKLASISLDAWISIGVQVWTLTPPQRPGVDAKGPSARTLNYAENHAYHAYIHAIYICFASWALAVVGSTAGITPRKYGDSTTGGKSPNLVGVVRPFSQTALQSFSEPCSVFQASKILPIAWGAPPPYIVEGGETITERFAYLHREARDLLPPPPFLLDGDPESRAVTVAVAGDGGGAPGWRRRRTKVAAAGPQQRGRVPAVVASGSGHLPRQGGSWDKGEGFPNIFLGSTASRNPEEGIFGSFLGLPKESFTGSFDPFGEFLKGKQELGVNALDAKISSMRPAILPSNSLNGQTLPPSSSVQNSLVGDTALEETVESDSERGE
ncbi:hypothetical protein Taro_004713 [Colocasia esculenta]|uniref:Uncharacterized protein n=1 Tax=Colocasia esculenta TaxID=4460 RepID=A0A843TIX9_COLES|nr:hypothetical protein [Colocasia esculenta]